MPGKKIPIGSDLSDPHYPLTVWTDPGGAVTDTPFVLLEAFGADLETAGAVPAVRLLQAAAAAHVFSESSLPVAGTPCIRHCCREAWSQRA